MCANMLQLGWKCKGWTSSRRPNQFRQKFGDVFYDIKSANHGGTEWRAEMWTGRVIPIRNTGGPGAVRAQNKGPAGAPGTVLRDDPPEPEGGGDGQDQWSPFVDGRD